VAQALYQRLCHGGQARANFHDGLAGLGVYGGNDGLNDAAVGQKVLAKTFTCDVFTVFAVLRWATH
jgi:hypothetical protein